ncbi:hypothetical protein ABT317_36045, partial [Streptomyces carpinensis]
EEGLRERGWLGEDGALTAAGAALHADVEARTDAVAEQPWTALGADAAARLADLLEPLAKAVLHTGLVPAGNPVGLTGALWASSPAAATADGDTTGA